MWLRSSSCRPSFSSPRKKTSNDDTSVTLKVFVAFFYTEIKKNDRVKTLKKCKIKCKLTMVILFKFVVYIARMITIIQKIFKSVKLFFSFNEANK